MALFWLRAFGYTAPLALYLLHKYSVVNVQVRYALTYRRWEMEKYRVYKNIFKFFLLDSKKVLSPIALNGLLTVSDH